MGRVLQAQARRAHRVQPGVAEEVGAAAGRGTPSGRLWEVHPLWMMRALPARRVDGEA